MAKTYFCWMRYSPKAPDSAVEPMKTVMGNTIRGADGFVAHPDNQRIEFMVRKTESGGKGHISFLSVDGKNGVLWEDPVEAQEIKNANKAEFDKWVGDGYAVLCYLKVD